MCECKSDQTRINNSVQYGSISSLCEIKVQGVAKDIVRTNLMKKVGMIKTQGKGSGKKYVPQKGTPFKKPCIQCNELFRSKEERYKRCGSCQTEWRKAHPYSSVNNAIGHQS